jgi:acetylornithine/N-succinyldiaminopimelate aminotransferase
MTAVGGAIMDTVLTPGFLDDVNAKGEYLQTGLAALSKCYHLGAVRGLGLLVALDLNRDLANLIAERARDAGLLLNAPRPQTLRFMPALTVSFEEIDSMLSILDETLAELIIEA